MTVAVTKTSFQKFQSRIINYWRYHHFRNDTFRFELSSELPNTDIKNSNDKFFDFTDAYKPER